MIIDEVRMIDIRSPNQIDILIADDNRNKKLWVNVEGTCLLRAQGVSNISIEDETLKGSSTLERLVSSINDAIVQNPVLDNHRKLALLRELSLHIEDHMISIKTDIEEEGV